MRHFFSTASLLIASGSFVSTLLAAETTSPSAADAAPVQGPRITFRNLVHDFGKLESGDVGKHEFIFTNTGNAPLEISAVKPACGCTTPGTWDKVVEPGKTGKIPVEFNSKSFSGDVKKTIQVSCNDPSQTNVTLEIKANIWKAFDISPSIATFSFPPDATDRQSKVVKIKSNLEEPVSLSEPVWTNKNYDAVLKTVTEGKEFELTISAAPPQAGTSATASFELKTSSQKSPTIQVSANALKQQPITLLPAQLTVPSTPLAKAITNKVTIRNNTTNAISVTDPALNLPGVDVKLNELQPGKVFTASVTFPEGFTLPAGQQLALTMKSTLPGNETIKVPVVQAQPGQRRILQAQPRTQQAPPQKLRPPQANANRCPLKLVFW